MYNKGLKSPLLHQILCYLYIGHIIIIFSIIARCVEAWNPMPQANRGLGIGLDGSVYICMCIYVIHPVLAEN